ncbi:MAG: hypothetical protein L3J89_01845 [Gammaproteobacteria bacterium]|nr:hypothetical protein [Gammaproteobacteria bacterium]
MDESLKKYRQQLVDTEQKVSESYDKTVIALSSGALAISFAFVKDFIGSGPASNLEYLFLSWVFLSLSLAAVLFSLFFGTLSFRKAISQVDDGTIYKRKAGGVLGRITISLHCSAAVLLIVGLFLLGNFVHKNIGVAEDAREKHTATATTEARSSITDEPGPGENASKPTAATSTSSTKKAAVNEP